MTFTRAQAKMIAEELYKLVKGDVVDAAKEVTKQETEEYLSVKEVAQMLKWAPITVYRRKDDIGCYVKSKNRILFIKSQVHRAIQLGRLA